MYHHWVKKSRVVIDHSKGYRIGVDETSSRKGHKYITLFVDLDTHRLIFSTKIKGEKTFDEFVKVLEPRGVWGEHPEGVSAWTYQAHSLPATLSILSHANLGIR